MSRAQRRLFPENRLLECGYREAVVPVVPPAEMFSAEVLPQ
ncbi:hypothetical protein [uncultured Parabacteroides sp.]|nr:hypothetical protein [uncultured Parabacteroides sp.]